MRLGNKVGLIIIFAIPVLIFVRAQFIYKEGPKVVKIIEDYKIKNGIYPKSLEQAKVVSILSPRYFSYNNDDGADGFYLGYSIFVFYRWHYISSKKEWKHID